MTPPNCCHHPTNQGPRSSFTFALLGNANHVILRLTLSKLLREGFRPAFVLEDEGTAALQRKTTWYNGMYDSTQVRGRTTYGTS